MEDDSEERRLHERMYWITRVVDLLKARTALSGFCSSSISSADTYGLESLIEQAGFCNSDNPTRPSFTISNDFKDVIAIANFVKPSWDIPLCPSKMKEV
jgi:hypothetical protein